MPVEVTILAFGALLLLAHVFAAANAKTKQYGVAWNMGARDEQMPPLGVVPGRLARAQANFLETLPIAIIALLGVVVAGRTSQWTEIGGWVWLGARIAYLPVYAMGVRGLRSVTFLASLVGLGMVIWPICIP
jgi:uncharacterized MAPEG superfamily protein